MSGSIDQIDLVSIPVNMCGGTGDCDSPLLFKLHMIHGRAVSFATDFLHAMDASGIKENPFAERGLAGVDMG